MPIINQIVKGAGGGGSGITLEYEISGGDLIHSTTVNSIMDFTGITKLTQSYMLYGAYRDNTVISGTVDMSDLVTISGVSACSYMFYNCTRITGVDLSSLTTMSATQGCSNMFYGCTGITGNVDLPSLTTISGGSGCASMFQGCSGITGVTLSSLATISGSSACANMFQNCTSLATVYIGGTTAIDFGTRTNQFQMMFSGCPQNIDVYAPAANQTAIEAFSGYPNFGATGTVTWHWRS